MKKNIMVAVLWLTLLALLPLNVWAQSKGQTFTGNNWSVLNKQQKVDAVSSFIKAGAKHGVTIKNTPSFYADKLDAFYGQHGNLKNEPLAKVLKTVMIMEYDWGARGINKERLAQRWLGDELYKKNKARLESSKK